MVYIIYDFGIKYITYMLYILYKKETCQSGRMYLFAKEAGSSKGPEGSNPSVSAITT